MLRTLTALSWVIGVLALILAIVGPWAYENWFVKREKGAIHRVLGKIAEAENAYFQQKQQYYLFDSLRQAEAFAILKLGSQYESQSEFLFDAFMSPKGDLVVRAIPRPGKITEKFFLLPPAVPLGVLWHKTGEAPKMRDQALPLSGRRMGFGFF
jgi:hypothetical protein